MSKVKKFRIISYKSIAKPTLKIKNVSKSFDGVPVLDNLNLNIESNDSIVWINKWDLLKNVIIVVVLDLYLIQTRSVIKY